MTLYSLPFHNRDLIEENIDMDSCVFLGKNWDFYFLNKAHKEAETIKNCRFVDKENKEKTFDYDREQDMYLQIK